MWLNVLVTLFDENIFVDGEYNQWEKMDGGKNSNPTNNYTRTSEYVYEDIKSKEMKPLLCNNFHTSNKGI